MDRNPSASLPDLAEIVMTRGLPAPVGRPLRPEPRARRRVEGEHLFGLGADRHRLAVDDPIVALDPVGDLGAPGLELDDRLHTQMLDGLDPRGAFFYRASILGHGFMVQWRADVRLWL